MYIYIYIYGSPPLQGLPFQPISENKTKLIEKLCFELKTIILLSKQYFSTEKLSFTKQNIAFEWKSFVLLSKTIVLNGKA